MLSNEIYLALYFALLPFCSGATATLPIKRTTVRYKFDDWQLYNQYVGAYQHTPVCVPQFPIELTYVSPLTL